jgi:hypothetical protein
MLAPKTDSVLVGALPSVAVGARRSSGSVLEGAQGLGVVRLWPPRWSFGRGRVGGLVTAGLGAVAGAVRAGGGGRQRRVPPVWPGGGW